MADLEPLAILMANGKANWPRPSLCLFGKTYLDKNKLENHPSHCLTVYFPFTKVTYPWHVLTSPMTLRSTSSLSRTSSSFGHPPWSAQSLRHSMHSTGEGVSSGGHLNVGGSSPHEVMKV